MCFYPRSTRQSAEPVKRLWRTLVHQESIQEIFIQNIFKREMETSQEVFVIGESLFTIIFFISISNSVSDGATNKSPLNIESS